LPSRIDENAITPPPEPLRGASSVAVARDVLVGKGVAVSVGSDVLVSVGWIAIVVGGMGVAVADKVVDGMGVSFDKFATSVDSEFLHPVINPNTMIVATADFLCSIIFIITFNLATRPRSRLAKRARLLPFVFSLW